jgi:hypothetical protein
MKECPQVQGSLSAYIDDALSWDEREAVDGHLAQCPACSAELDSLRRTVELCRRLGDVEVPVQLRAAIKAKVRQLGPPRARRLPMAMTALAATLILGIGLSLALGLGGLAPSLGGGFRLLGRGQGTALDLAPAGAPAAQFTTREALPSPPADAGRTVGEVVPMMLPRAPGVRMLVKRADLFVEVPDGQLQEAERQALELVETARGYIERSSTVEDAAGRRTTSITARVPEDAFTRVLGQLDGLGKARHRNVESDDVTVQYIDLAAHVRNHEAQEARLLEIMRQARTVSEVMQVENELQRVRAAIDAGRGRLRHYQLAAAMSTIALTLREEGAGGVTPARAGFWWEIYRAFLGSTKGLAIFLARLAPYLLLVSVGAFWLVSRRRKVS